MNLLSTPVVRNPDNDNAAYRGLALQRMAVLRDYMKAGSINVASQVTRLANGVEITCQKCWDRENIYIYVPVAPVLPVKPSEIIYLFALHPHSQHSADYPFNPLHRGVITEELVYTAPDEADNATVIQAGNCYWHGTDSTLSWRGSPGFNIALDKDQPFQEITTEDIQNPSLLYLFYTAFGPYVYEKQEVAFDATDKEGLVVGACRFSGSLIVIVRIYDGERFRLQVYGDSELKDTVAVGRFNSIWNFKADGSAGISLYDNVLYRVSMTMDDKGKLFCTFSTPEQVNTGAEITLNPSRTVTRTSTVEPVISGSPCLEGLFEIGTVPTNVARLSSYCRDKWNKMLEQVSTQENKTIVTAAGSGEYIINYGYDEDGNEIPVVLEVEIDLKHHYETRTVGRKDAMLIMPLGGTGRRITSDYLRFVSGTANIGDLVEYIGCDTTNHAISGIALSKISDTLYSVTAKPCAGTQWSVTNCTSNTASGDNPPPDSMSIGHDTEPVRKGSYLTVSGGVPPYSWSGITGTTNSDGSQLTITGCPAISSGCNVTVTVTDSCGISLQHTFSVKVGWVQISRIDSGVSYCDPYYDNPSSCSGCTPGQNFSCCWYALSWQFSSGGVAAPPADCSLTTYTYTGMTGTAYDTNQPGTCVCGNNGLAPYENAYWGGGRYWGCNRMFTQIVYNLECVE